MALETTAPRLTAPGVRPSPLGGGEIGSAPVLAQAVRLSLPDGADGAAAALEAIRYVLRRSAERHPGFVSGVDTAQEPSGHDQILLSLWRSPADITDFVHASHPEVLRARYQSGVATFTVERALWWITDGRRPTPAEAAARLSHLRRHGPSTEAFTLRSPVPAP